MAKGQTGAGYKIQHLGLYDTLCGLFCVIRNAQSSTFSLVDSIWLDEKRTILKALAIMILLE
jgi:hypothetical protein